MYPLHDNDLDRLSRNAAEHYEVDFGSSGWEQLEKRLDQELPRPRDRRRFLFWLFFIVVTTGSALIGLLISSQPTSQPLAANNIRAMAPVNRMQAPIPAERAGDAQAMDKGVPVGQIGTAQARDKNDKLGGDKADGMVNDDAVEKVAGKRNADGSVTDKVVGDRTVDGRLTDKVVGDRTVDGKVTNKVTGERNIDSKKADKGAGDRKPGDKVLNGKVPDNMAADKTVNRNVPDKQAADRNADGSFTNGGVLNNRPANSPLNNKAKDKITNNRSTAKNTADDRLNANPNVQPVYNGNASSPATQNPASANQNTTTLKPRTSPRNKPVTDPNNTILTHNRNSKPSNTPSLLSQKPSTDNKKATDQSQITDPGTDNNNIANSQKPNNKPAGSNPAKVEDINSDDTTNIQTPGNTPVIAKNATQQTDSTLAKTNQPKPFNTDSTEKSDQPKIPHTYKQTWEFGILAGPDGSMVEFGPLFKAGYNFGVQIGYRFNDRWSINTGLIYTRKYYQADSNTFHAPKHSYPAYLRIQYLKGYCAMWDIPVNIRYDISYNDKRRFFASAGASTYLMNRQFYDYAGWYRSNGNWFVSDWDSETSGEYFKKNYLFSVLNLSAGYERRLNKRFSIQAEPYLKIPLTGMGFGTMKIGSYGMFFSLKYHPTFRSTPKK